jgi:hypothetical protein
MRGGVEIAETFDPIDASRIELLSLKTAWPDMKQ